MRAKILELEVKLSGTDVSQSMQVQLQDTEEIKILKKENEIYEEAVNSLQKKNKEWKKNISRLSQELLEAQLFKKKIHTALEQNQDKNGIDLLNILQNENLVVDEGDIDMIARNQELRQKLKKSKAEAKRLRGLMEKRNIMMQNVSNELKTDKKNSQPEADGSSPNALDSKKKNVKRQSEEKKKQK